MTTIKSLITKGILAASVLIFLNQCKSPAQQQEAIAYPSKDTVSVVDSTKDAKLPSTVDTVHARIPLTLIITNLKSTTGSIVVGVYSEKDKFPDPKGQLKVYNFKPDSVSLTAIIRDLPFGTYAMAIYQDVNGNGKIDKNMIGIPTEPYAFSNNYKPTVKAPSFKNCRFNYSSATNTIAMKMIR